MQIFVLDRDPVVAARYHMDVHVNSQIRESVQLLCTVAWLQGLDREWLRRRVHAPTHEHHPCVKWLLDSQANIHWLLELLNALHAQWQLRFDHENELHKSYGKLLANVSMLSYYWRKVPIRGLTPFAQAMKDNPECLDVDAVKAYRKFYHTKRGGRFETWRNGAPGWWRA